MQFIDSPWNENPDVYQPGFCGAIGMGAILKLKVSVRTSAVFQEIAETTAPTKIESLVSTDNIHIHIHKNQNQKPWWHQIKSCVKRSMHHGTPGSTTIYWAQNLPGLQCFPDAAGEVGPCRHLFHRWTTQAQAEKFWWEKVTLQTWWVVLGLFFCNPTFWSS